MAGKSRVAAAFRRAVGEEPDLPQTERRPGVSVLLNERRRRIFLTVLDRPGIHLRELSRALDVPLQSLSWHVEILKKAGLLQGLHTGKFEILAVPGQADPETLRDLALLDVVKNAAIIHVLRKRARTRSEVSGDLQVYPQALDPSLRSLVTRGLIVRDPSRVEFEVGPRFQAIVQSFRDTEKRRETRLLGLLAKDGLQPEVTGREDAKVEIEINGARKRLRIHAPLMPHVLRVLAK